MTYWNHRVMRRNFDGGDSEYGIHEVYYNENDKVEAWTENPIAPTETTIKELQQTLERMKLALKKPILDYKTGKAIKAQKQLNKYR
jgi:hypothetical protein